MGDVLNFGPLSDEEKAMAKMHGKSKGGWRPILPIPEGAGRSSPHLRHGKPDKTWCYRDGQGNPLGYICRFDKADGAKIVLPLVYAEGPKGKRSWRWQGFPEPRPLFNLDRLATRPDASALVCEGEKAADAAQAMFPDMVAVTSPSGSKAAHLADWRPLGGRQVFIWPDHDEPGRAYAEAVAGLVIKAGAAAVKIVLVPGDFRPGWDLADELPESWDKERLLALLEAAPPAPPAPPQAESPDQPSDWPFRLDERGVWFLAEDKEGNTERQWLCSPLGVMAHTRDSRGEDWGRLLKVSDADGVEHLWAMPRSLAAGDGREYRARLLALGLNLATGRKSNERLALYLATANPQARIRCVARTGWYGDAFILPDRTFGHSGKEGVVFQGSAAQDHAFRVAGSLEEWKEQVCRYCVGNSRLVFAVCVALAAPLLRMVNIEGGGFHFRGASARGKTTTLLVAGSVWGGGEDNGYIRSWRATTNGLEAVGAGNNDCLLCLDEISQMDSDKVGEAAEMLANGAGKTRGRPDGSGAPALQFRLLFLSTGEQTLADKMAEVGKRARAGQEVRLADIPADAGAGWGIFENLHGFPSPAALADHLRQASTQIFGHPIRAFLRMLTDEPQGLPAVADELKKWMEDFRARYCPSDADGQVQRTCRRFGLAAAAGELGAQFGVLQWPEGEAMKACGINFRAWLEQRGGIEALELSQGRTQIRRFFQNHGEDRFTTIGDDGKALGPKTLDRVGFRRKTRTEQVAMVGQEEQEDRPWEYLVFIDAFKHMVCKGFDHKAMARELKRLGWIRPGSNGDLTPSLKIEGKKYRFYRFTPQVLEDEAGEGEA